MYKYFFDGVSIVSEMLFVGNSVLVPQKYIRGNPVNWEYQAVAISEFGGEEEKVIIDFLNQGA